MTNSNPTETGDGPSDEAIASFREFREYARGDLDVDHSAVYPWTGLISDPRLREVLAFMKETYDPGSFADRRSMPRKFEHTEFFNRAINKWATESATRAVRDGNVSQTTYMTGLPGYDSDVSGIHAINRLADWLVNSEQCKLIYLAALMGRGKTDFALLLFEIIYDHYGRLRQHHPDSVETPEFAVNFSASTPDDVDAEIDEIHKYSGLLEWASGGSSDDEKWFIFDEASTELTAQSGANAQEVAETFAPFVKKMRKKGVNMIVIGHDRGDVHPAIRAIASFIDKKSTKTADIYEGIKSREPFGHYLSIDSIPSTSWEFDTDDVARWEWDVEVVDDDQVDDDAISEEQYREWRDERITAVYEETGLSQRDVGELFDVSQKTVGRAVESTDVDVSPAPSRSEEAAD